MDELLPHVEAPPMVAALIHAACPKCGAVYSRVQASAGDDTMACRECGHRFVFSKNIQRPHMDPLVKPFPADRSTGPQRVATSVFPDLELPAAKGPNHGGHDAPSSSDGLGESIGRYIEKHLLDSPSIDFKHPFNGYIETVPRLVWLWVLVFGFFYFAVKGVWTHAVAGLVLTFMTVGLSWLAYPFFARSIMRAHYLRRGWIELPSPSESS